MTVDDGEDERDLRHPLLQAAEQAERAMLGALLLDPDRASELIPLLNPESFTRPVHELIWEAAANLHADGTVPVHPVLVERLGRDPIFRNAGGHAVLLELRPDFDPAPQPEQLARIVRDAAIWRHTGAAITEARRLLADADPTTLQVALEKVSTLAADAAHPIGQAATRRGSGLRLSRGGSFVLDAPTTVPAIWGDGNDVLWAEGEALMIVGPQGVGKSTLIQQLVRGRLGIGSIELLGHTIQPSQQRVLYLACDRPRQIRRSLARMFTDDDRDALDDRLAIWEGPPPYDFAKHPNALLDLATAAHADTVVVDSIKDVALGLSDDEVGAAYNRARQTALAAGVQVIEAHHNVKRGATPGKAPNTLADVYGSVWITAGAGSVLLLWGAAGDPVVDLTQLKQPVDEVGPLRVLHDHTTGHSTTWHSTDLLAIARASPNGLTAKNAATALFATDNPTSAQIQKGRRRLDALETKGLLRKHSGDQKTATPDSYHPADQLPIGDHP